MQLVGRMFGPIVGRLRLPAEVPPFSTPIYRTFSVLWTIAFLLALIGPAMGMYERYNAPANNSQLLLGSRAGFAAYPGDATAIRFAVGPNSGPDGLHAGDKIVAIYGIDLPRVMPVTEQALAEHGQEPAYIAMGNLLFGSDEGEVPLTIRAPDGRVRDVTVQTGEQHINAAARKIGIQPRLLNFVDLLPVLAYPFLLWAAWALHRRKARDVVSSLLSLAFVLTMAAEQPSTMFLATIGIPRWLNVAMFDLGNVLLLASIILFPHGRLSTGVAAVLVSLPVLLFLHGQVYQAYFVFFMLVAVVMLLRSMRQSVSDDSRQQIRWALFGFAGYAALRGVSILCDLFKWSTHSFGGQMLVEVLAGVCFGLGTLVLMFGLLVALLRYRLYDADSIIQRTASVAIVTIVITGGFAAIMEGIITGLQFLYPESETSQTFAAMAGAIFAAACIEPVRDKARHWTEQRFQKNLFLLRDDLPEAVRDLRETASLQEMLDETLARIEAGVRSVHNAFIIHGRIMATRDVSTAAVEDWRGEHAGFSNDLCEPKDKMFPLRVALIPSSEKKDEPIGYVIVGPRPDGSIPSKEEQKALAGVSEPIARAIVNVIKREERERELNDSIEATNRRIDTLEALLRGPSLKRSPGTA